MDIDIAISHSRIVDIMRVVGPLFEAVHRRRGERAARNNEEHVFKRLLNEPRDMEPVWAALRKLNEDEVYALKTLMYRGRDGGSPVPFRDDKERMILDVTEKRQFVEYVEAGIAGRLWKPNGKRRSFRP